VVIAVLTYHKFCGRGITASNGFNGFGTALVRRCYGIIFLHKGHRIYGVGERKNRDEGLNHVVCPTEVLFCPKKNRRNCSKDQQSASAEPMMAPFLCFDCVEQRFSVQERMLFHPSPSVFSLAYIIKDL